MVKADIQRGNKKETNKAVFSQCRTLALFANDAKCFRTTRSASDCVLFHKAN